MSKLLSDWRTGMLGAVGGVFSCAVLLLVERVEAYHAELQRLASEGYLEEPGITSYSTSLHPLWWAAPALWHIILFVVASFFVHRYFRRTNSPFLLWQAVGAAAIVSWALSLFLFVSLDAMITNDIASWETVLDSSKQWYAFKLVASVAAINTVYSTAIQIAAKHYTQVEESTGVGSH